MILVAILLIPLLAGLVALLVGASRPALARVTCMLALLVDGGLVLSTRSGELASDPWYVQARWEWIPELGVTFHVGLDGLSFPFALLATFLSFIAVWGSWTQVQRRVGLFHFNLMAVTTGLLGVFFSLDLFVFYFFWELMLVPMCFLIGIWGHERRVYAAVKFFVFTQAGGLAMLLAMLGLVSLHARQTGVMSFDYFDLLGTQQGSWGPWLAGGFFLAFAVKLPAVPLHTWLPDAHTEAPTAGSIVLAGVMLKTGGYGLIRFGVPLFPEAASMMAPVGMALGAFGILYGATLAFGQRDFKRMVAYTSVSHLGFVLLGVFAWSQVALEGALVQMVCHGLSTGGLFLLAGILQERLGTRDMDALGGLRAVVPKMAAFATVLAMASLGLPGLGNFVGELLVLLGAFPVSPVITSCAVVGLIVAMAYSLAILERMFRGPLGAAVEKAGRTVADLTPREVTLLGFLVVGLLVMGLAPGLLLDVSAPALEAVRELAAGSQGG